MWFPHLEIGRGLTRIRRTKTISHKKAQKAQEGIQCFAFELFVPSCGKRSLISYPRPSALICG
ncbi:MAG: hypothetical protein DMF74_18670 [Acidobacteria bacterium]|nr:MAG: hypothetical protein DMF74_18670 [Acidobacteriota bacterium]